MSTRQKQWNCRIPDLIIYNYAAICIFIYLIFVDKSASFNSALEQQSSKCWCVNGLILGTMQYRDTRMLIDRTDSTQQKL
jgi:hypothetical protein